MGLEKRVTALEATLDELRADIKVMLEEFDRRVIAHSQTDERVHATLEEFNKLLEDRRIQRVLNST